MSRVVRDSETNVSINKIAVTLANRRTRIFPEFQILFYVVCKYCQVEAREGGREINDKEKMIFLIIPHIKKYI